jgi:hypothetical protein
VQAVENVQYTSTVAASAPLLAAAAPAAAAVLLPDAIAELEELGVVSIGESL